MGELPLKIEPELVHFGFTNPVQFTVFEILLHVDHRLRSGSDFQFRDFQGGETGQADLGVVLGGLVNPDLGRLQKTLVDVGVFAAAFFEIGG
mgnify:CR=1 FL=1